MKTMRTIQRAGVTVAALLLAGSLAGGAAASSDLAPRFTVAHQLAAESPSLIVERA